LAGCQTNWNVIAREAQRAHGLNSLLAGEVVERSKQGRATARALRAAIETGLSAQLERATEAIPRARNAGARLVTVLDDE
jgi:hypothetical protein